MASQALLSSPIFPKWNTLVKNIKGGRQAWTKWMTVPIFCEGMNSDIYSVRFKKIILVLFIIAWNIILQSYTTMYWSILMHLPSFTNYIKKSTEKAGPLLNSPLKGHRVYLLIYIRRRANFGNRILVHHQAKSQIVKYGFTILL